MPANLFDRLFFSHPRKVNETYAEHWRTATRFAVLMLGAGFAALIHALCPVLFERTGSGIVKRLYDEMAGRQAQPSD
jgi:hypothetical protein